MDKNTSKRSEHVAPLDLSRHLQLMDIQGTPSPYGLSPSMYSCSSMSSTASPSVNQPSKSFTFSRYDIEHLLSTPNEQGSSAAAAAASTATTSQSQLPWSIPAQSSAAKQQQQDPANLQSTSAGQRQVEQCQQNPNAELDALQARLLGNGNEKSAQSPLVKDGAYYEKRRKNNESAKRSRNRRRERGEKMIEHIRYLENDRSELQMQLAISMEEVAQLRLMCQNMMN